jgi:hypothetical protein
MIGFPIQRAIRMANPTSRAPVSVIHVGATYYGTFRCEVGPELVKPNRDELANSSSAAHLEDLETIESAVADEMRFFSQVACHTDKKDHCISAVVFFVKNLGSDLLSQALCA